MSIKISNLLKFSGILLIIVLVYITRNILVLFLLAYIVSNAIRPIIEKLESYRIKREISAIFIDILIIISLVAFFTNFVGVLVSELQRFVEILPELLSRILDIYKSYNPNFAIDTKDLVNVFVNEFITSIDRYQSFLSGFSTNLTSIGSVSIKFINSVASFLFTTFFFIIIVTYLNVRKNSLLEDIITFFVKNELQEKYIDLIKKIEKNLFNWFFTQTFFSVFVGFSVYIIILLPGLFIDGYQLGKLAFILGLFAAMMELIPNFGPVLLSTIVLILSLALGESAFTTIFLSVALIVLQQIQNYLLVPSIFKKTIKIDPVLTIFSILSGYAILGIFGAILSVPIVTTLIIIYKNLRK